MSIDVDRLADELVRGAQLLVDRALAPVLAETARLREECAALTVRLAVVESRAAEPGPPGRDGTDGKDGAPGERGADGAPGRDGVDGKDGASGRDGAAGERGADGLPGRDGVDGKDGAPGRDGVDGINGKDGAPGERGADGMLPVLRSWEDRVYRAGECAVLSGATWQAAKDTGKAPPHDDWTCIAAAGADGRSLVARGTFDPEQTYRSHEIVALNGGSFVALRDDPGECPGPGWQLLTAPGKRGQRGEDGQRGATGERGERGLPGPGLAGADLTDDGLLTITMADGTQAQADFYPVLRRLE
jgi:hypothetical protein